MEIGGGARRWGYFHEGIMGRTSVTEQDTGVEDFEGSGEKGRGGGGDGKEQIVEEGPGK